MIAKAINAMVDKMILMKNVEFVCKKVKILIL